jgi:hypothetical protein
MNRSENINLNNLILAKEIQLIQKGIKFKGKNGENFTLFGDLLMIKGDIPQVHESLNLKAFSICCYKCEAEPKDLIIFKKKKEKKKKNWDVEGGTIRTIPNTIKNLLSIDSDKHNCVGVSPLVYLYNGKSSFDYFVNTIGCDELHNKLFINFNFFNKFFIKII